ncbi:hypothetical protein RND71_043839 [Anisodus tanguticus]|uniref:Uncharacterized protein n=1 Tax=Anisodus tanguticus TaxID=243964 RepID=A0AAE1QSP6_9SOLA|nr:hypothetical protein RND71_043839 [Anisodus tanguticus]
MIMLLPLSHMPTPRHNKSGGPTRGRYSRALFKSPSLWFHFDHLPLSCFGVFRFPGLVLSHSKPYLILVSISLSLYGGENHFLWTRFSSLPSQKKSLLFGLFHLFFALCFFKSLLWLGLLLMDELSKALFPFYPSSMGMHVGSSGQPPLPSPSDPGSFHIPVSQDPEENPPGGSHPPVHQQQDETSAPHNLGQKKIEAVLEKHLRRHCQLVEVRTKYPQLNSTEIDYYYLAKNMAISQLDTDLKTDSEIADLAASVKNYKNIKSLLDDFLDSYYKEDD